MIDEILKFIGKIFFITVFVGLTILTIYGVVYLGITLLEFLRGAL